MYNGFKEYVYYYSLLHDLFSISPEKMDKFNVMIFTRKSVISCYRPA